MILRLLLLFFLFVHPFYISAQTDKEFSVEYKRYNDSSMPNIYMNTLWIKGDCSIFQSKLYTQVDWEEKMVKDTTGVTVRKKPMTFDPLLKIDISKKQMFFYDKIGNNMMLVSDTYYDFKWIITEDRKKIAGFTCSKATTSYRGRNWVAWFTTDIPISFGPWKLHGLPGLILEAYDADHLTTFVAEKIEQKKGSLFEKDFGSIYEHTNAKPISNQQFMADTDEYYYNIKKQYAVDGVSIEKTKYPRTGPELKYEWE
ncbi:GLPGLI family protein [Flavobacterium sp. RHBU_24]|uniref:GLPGLI family protein n=1 Tax=Flavobacterium sp. RHBU_24 TaxID=3391185 RepID=UPI003985498D